jgi:aspartyl-tRNA(Asn)/glutamyl-tRNA(Gln) amidotransferase subunit C
MSISIEEVKKLASLSRIQLGEEEAISLQNEISSILGYVEEINSATFPEIEGGLSEVHNIWRNDQEVNETGAYTEKILANAPGREGDYVKVKNIM